MRLSVAYPRLNSLLSSRNGESVAYEVQFELKEYHDEYAAAVTVVEPGEMDR